MRTESVKSCVSEIESIVPAKIRVALASVAITSAPTSILIAPGGQSISVNEQTVREPNRPETENEPGTGYRAVPDIVRLRLAV